MRKLIELAKRNIGDILMLGLLLVIFIVLLIKTDSDKECKCEKPTIIQEITEPTADIQENTTVEVSEPQSEVPSSEVTYECPTNVEVYEQTIHLIGCSWGEFFITLEDFELLCTTVFCEAGNQDIETQAMACLTILNRYKAGYADSIREVIYQDGAYAVTKWDDFEKRGWTEQVEMAVQYALDVNEHPRDMYYFRTNHYHKFAENYMKSGDLYFSTHKEGCH